MTWLMRRSPNEKRRLQPPFLASLAPLAQRGERLLGVLGERVSGLALDELLEAGAGARLVAHRRARERGAEHGVAGERALRVRLQERVVGLRRLGELAGVGERLRGCERLALALGGRI